MPALEPEVFCVPDYANMDLTDSTSTKNEEVNLKKLVDDGIIQEANRTFFHIFGLSLCVVEVMPGEFCLDIEQTKAEEGFFFTEEFMKSKKAMKNIMNVIDLFHKAMEERSKNPFFSVNDLGHQIYEEKNG